MVRRALLASALCGTLAACEVGPDFHLPEMALFNAREAQGDFVSERDAAFSKGALPPHWWRLYRDPVLDRLIADAFAANTDLREAAANLERTHALLQQARVARQPGVAFNYNPEYGRLSAEEFLQPHLIPTAVFYDLGLSASYEVDLFGRLKRGIEAAEASDEAAVAARDVARVTVAASVTSAYTDLCGATEELEAAKRLVALQRQRYAYVRRLLVAGRGTPIETTQNRGQVSQVESQLPVFVARQRNAQFRLAVLTGRPPKNSPTALVQCSAAPIIASPIPVGDGTALLHRRPDIREAERTLAAATAEIGVATADLYPRVSLGVAIGSTGVMQDFLEPLTNRYSVGPGITWQLNQSEARARIDEAEAETRGELARFDGVVLNALKETETALNNYARALQRDARLEAVRDRAKQTFVYLSRLETGGRNDSLSTLDAARALASTQLALAESRSEVSSAQVAVFLALGGGWEDQSKDATHP
jgi:NodT family efflux transporter outer membrane factor (OMF) lipoprotein